MLTLAPALPRILTGRLGKRSIEPCFTVPQPRFRFHGFFENLWALSLSMIEFKNDPPPVASYLAEACRQGANGLPRHNEQTKSSPHIANAM